MRPYSINISLLIPCIFYFTLLHAQTSHKEDDIFYWTKEQPLTFAHFEGKPGKEDTAFYKATATTTAHRLGSITKGIHVHFVTARGQTVFTIYAGMKKNLSWIKNNGDSVSLKHEQGHFDICEIYARVLRKDIKNATSLADAKKLFEKITADEEQEHDRYDQQNTFQSGGITIQWSEKINRRLKELDAYKQPVVVLPFAQ